jgi:hypothetical protein
MSEIQKLAKRERLSVGEWVRQALRQAREARPVNTRAVQYSFPTADIGQMLDEIERGYRE